MNSRHLWATAATIVALSAFDSHFPGVWAQTSDVAACRSGWDWNKNSLGQDPCVISSMLDAACRGVASYSIPALNSTQNYVPPQRNSTSDLTCDCDTVMYSLYMACTTCQGGVIYSWMTWIAQCDTVYVSQYPHDVAQGTAIPQWAFFNVTNLPDQIYNDTVAITIGRNPEATPKPISTVSLGGSSTLPSSTRTSTSSPIITSGSSGGKSNTGAIVGGVVGGVVGLFALAAAALFFIRRRGRGGANQLSSPPPHTPGTSDYYKVQPASPVFTPSSQNVPFNAYYNPEDPSTFPPPMSDGQSSLTYGTQGQNPGRYSGMPEVS